MTRTRRGRADPSLASPGRLRSRRSAGRTNDVGSAVVLVDDEARGTASLQSREFVALMATCMAMAALSIDLMLPAFADMREDFDLAPDSTAVSWVLTAFFLGLAAGQLVYGPLSDRFGRKPMLYAGLAIYVVSGTAAAFMPSLAGL